MKSTAVVLIASLLFQTMVPVLSCASGRRKGARVEPITGRFTIPSSNSNERYKKDSKDQSVVERWLHKERARVRVEAPMISKSPIIGRFVRVNQHALVILSERGREERMPLSSVENFEVSIKRSRNTAKGMLFGVVLAGAYFFPGVLLDEADILDLRSASAAIFLSSTLIGAVTKSDKWVEVSPHGLKPNVAYTQNRGIRAALSFEF